MKGLILALFLLCASTAYADPIVITSGSGQSIVEGTIPTQLFSFNFQNSDGSLFTNIFTITTANVIGFPQSGPSVNLNFYGAGNDVIGTFTYNDQTYFSFSNLRFTATATMPDYVLGQESHVFCDFAFVGTLWGGTTSNPNTTQHLISVPVVGGGSVDATVFASIENVFTVRQIAYTFASPPQQATQLIPEPMSLLLLGSGLVILFKIPRSFLPLGRQLTEHSHERSDP